MKRIFIFTALLLFSCDKQEISKNQIEQNISKDCNCNRVMEHTKLYVVGDAQANPPTQGHYFGTYVLINDCTGVQYNGNWSGKNGDSEPINGKCYNK